MEVRIVWTRGDGIDTKDREDQKDSMGTKGGLYMRDSIRSAEEEEEEGEEGAAMG